MFWAHDKFLFLSPTEGKNNPLTFDYKYELCNQAFNDIDLYVMGRSKKDFFDCIKSVYEHGYSELDIVVGHDRHDELDRRVHMYNGTGGLYNFRSIRVHAIHRDDMSATRMREAAATGDYDFFVNGLPTKLRSRGLEIYERVREACPTKVLEST